MIQPSVNVPMEDAKRIIAKYFGVPEKNVIKNQYSYTVIGATIPEELMDPEDPDAK